jgi:hypothetical protein
MREREGKGVRGWNEVEGTRDREREGITKGRNGDFLLN